MSSGSSSRSSGAASQAGRIGPYQIGREIGKGSFAVVHKGVLLPEHDRDAAVSSSVPSRPTKEVAIKIVTRRKLTQKLLANLDIEIAILKEVSHHNIVELLDCLTNEAYIYLVMDFSSGGDLSQYIRNKGVLANDPASLSKSFVQAAAQFPHPKDGGVHHRVVRSFLEQLASAMEFMRVRNIVHRDIKPQNLLLQPPTPDFIARGYPAGIPQMKVADFGFARSLPAASLAETLCGSPLYMAPEILRYEKYDAKADLWSIGAVTFEMAVGKPPFKATNHVELLRRIERTDDRIRFPDERSETTWLREVQKRRESGEKVSYEEEKRGPTKLDDDLKILIRGLLKRNAVERMSFDDFFSSPVILDVRPAKAKEEVIEAPQAVSSKPMRSSNEGLPPRPTPGPALPLQPAPSTRIQAPPPLPVQPLPRFKPKYVVAQKGGPSSQTSSGKRSETSANASTSRAAGPDPAASDVAAKAVIPQEVPLATSGASGLPATSSSTSPQQAASTDMSSSQRPQREEDDEAQYVMIEKGNVEINALADELAYSPSQQRGPIASGAANAAALLSRRPSRLSRLSSGFSAAVGVSTAPTFAATPATSGAASSTAPSTAIESRDGASQPIPVTATPAPRPTLTSSPTAPVASSPSAPFALPPGARRQSFASRRASTSANSSPRPSQTSITPPRTASVVAQVQNTAVGEDEKAQVEGSSQVSDALQRIPPTSISASPGSALARAISNASQKLFGTPSGMSLRGAAAMMRNRGVGIAYGGISTRALTSGAGQEEATLLLRLDDCGRKAFVLCEFADSKLSSVYSEGPHQPSWGASHSQLSTTAPSPTMGRQRSPSLSSSVTSTPGTDALLYSHSETVASEALVIYIKSMGFLQRGIEFVKMYIDARGGRVSSSPTVSMDINDAVQQLRKRFNETFERADFARSKSSTSATSNVSPSVHQQAGQATGILPESAQNVNKLIYDKAMDLARAAAMDELDNNTSAASQAPPTTSPSSGESLSAANTQVSSQWDIYACLLAYETAATMLACLLDPVAFGSSQTGAGSGSGSGAGGAANDLEETSAMNIEPFIKSIAHRTSALRRRIGASAGVGGNIGGDIGGSV